MLQGKLPRNIPLEYPAGLYCCYVVIIVLSIAVVALSVALSGEWLTLQILRPSVHIHIVSYTHWALWARHCGKGSRENTWKFLFSGNLGSSRKMQWRNSPGCGVHRRPGSASLGSWHPAGSRQRCRGHGTPGGTVQGRGNLKRWGQRRVISPERYSASHHDPWV